MGEDDENDEELMAATQRHNEVREKIVRDRAAGVPPSITKLTRFQMIKLSNRLNYSILWYRYV
jgi:hypothetical protein